MWEPSCRENGIETFRAHARLVVEVGNAERLAAWECRPGTLPVAGPSAGGHRPLRGHPLAGRGRRTGFRRLVLGRQRRHRPGPQTRWSGMAGRPRCVAAPCRRSPARRQRRAGPGRLGHCHDSCARPARPLHPDRSVAADSPRSLARPGGPRSMVAPPGRRGLRGGCAQPSARLLRLRRIDPPPAHGPPAQEGGDGPCRPRAGPDPAGGAQRQLGGGPSPFRCRGRWCRTSSFGTGRMCRSTPLLARGRIQGSSTATGDGRARATRRPPDVPWRPPPVLRQSPCGLGLARAPEGLGVVWTEGMPYLRPGPSQVWSPDSLLAAVIAAGGLMPVLTRKVGRTVASGRAAGFLGGTLLTAIASVPKTRMALRRGTLVVTAVVAVGLMVSGSEVVQHAAEPGPVTPTSCAAS